MFNRFILVLTLISSMIGFSTAQAGKAYRWVDENGVIHYTQTPPPDKSATRIPPPPPPSSDRQKARDQLDRRWQENEIRNEARQKQEQQAAEEADMQAARETNCQAARNNLEILQGSPRKLIRTPDGEYHRVDPAVRQEQIEKAEKMIQENCN